MVNTKNDWPPAPKRDDVPHRSVPMGGKAKVMSGLVQAFMGMLAGPLVYLALVKVGEWFFGESISGFENTVHDPFPLAIFWRVPIVIIIALLVMLRAAKCGAGMLVTAVTCAVLHGIYVYKTMAVDYFSSHP